MPARLDPRGIAGPTEKQARGPHWERVSHGCYVPATPRPPQDADLEALAADRRARILQRIATAAVLLPATGAVTGWAALAWQGVDGVEGPLGCDPAVDLAVERSRIRRQPGYRVSAEFYRPEEVVALDGLRITQPVRSATFAARHAAGLREAVRILDLAADRDLVSRQELADYCVRRLTATTGVGQLRTAIGLMSENVWSPAETEPRLLWVLDLGIAQVLCNQPVFDLAGRHVGTPDLLDVEAGMVGEYNGAAHMWSTQRAKDLTREAAFRRVGLEYVEMVAPDRADPAAFLRRSREARARALARNPGGTAARAWTTTPPAWWTPTVTVAQRRALTPAQRARFLGRRAG